MKYSFKKNGCCNVYGHFLKRFYGVTMKRGLSEGISETLQTMG